MGKTPFVTLRFVDLSNRWFDRVVLLVVGSSSRGTIFTLYLTLKVGLMLIKPIKL